MVCIGSRILCCRVCSIVNPCVKTCICLTWGVDGVYWFQISLLPGVFDCSPVFGTTCVGLSWYALARCMNLMHAQVFVSC